MSKFQASEIPATVAMPRYSIAVFIPFKHYPGKKVENAPRWFPFYLTLISKSYGSSLSLSPSFFLLRIYRLINNKTEEGTQPAELHRKEAFKNFKQPFHGYIACSIHPCYSCFRSIRFFFDR